MGETRNSFESWHRLKMGILFGLLKWEKGRHVSPEVNDKSAEIVFDVDEPGQKDGSSAVSLSSVHVAHTFRTPPSRLRGVHAGPQTRCTERSSVSPLRESSDGLAASSSFWWGM